MIDGIYIIHRASGRLMFEKQFQQFPVDTDLFSSLLTAIRSFTEAIHMGELTTFSTHNHKIIISLTETLIIALLLEPNASVEKYQGLAYEIGYQFFQIYKQELANWSGNRAIFTSFDKYLAKALVQEDPFIVKVAKWATKEYGGDLHLNQELITNHNKAFLVNIIIDRGELKDLSLREKLITKFYHGYNRDLIFFKVSDDRIGLHDLEQFLQSCKDLGYECHQKERCEHYFDYFPSKIIIIAPHFSPNAIDWISSSILFDSKLNKHYIISNQLQKYLQKITKKGKFFIFRCYIELWQWDSPYPKRILQ
ncbi:MAG: hypothetical protein ACTSRS_16720 [Candidatus Helarchaeota archaeon]